MFYRIEKFVHGIADLFNWVAAAAVAAMMLLTCADVMLRLFRRPIPGTYEMVGLLGGVFAAFSLGYTSIKRGHIAVDFLVQRLPEKARKAVDGANALICGVLFGCIAASSLAYGHDLKKFGEVSMTLQMPIYPFIYGIAAGCTLLTLVLLLRCLKSILELLGNGSP